MRVVKGDVSGEICPNDVGYDCCKIAQNGKDSSAGVFDARDCQIDGGSSAWMVEARSLKGIVF